MRRLKMNGYKSLRRMTVALQATFNPVKNKTHLPANTHSVKAKSCQNTYISPWPAIRHFDE